MIDEAKQGIAIDYVLGELSSAEAAAFEKEVATNQELRDFTRELANGYASLALTAGPVRPRPDLFSRILAETNSPKRPKLILVSFLPWALAACLAIGLLVLSLKDYRTEAELGELSRRDVLAHLQIASLQAQVNSYAKASAIVVWNPQRQSGLVRLDELPASEPGHDYQLWIIDPSEKAPVSAGVVPVGNGNAAVVEFQPVHRVTTAAKFAVSIEKAGGSSVPQGQIILVGD
jgi:anti-sigma-K factor RskA